MNLQFKVQPGNKLTGNVRVPGDKSVSHRSIMLGAIAEGVTEVTGFLEGEDAISTMNAFRAMGVRIDGPHQGRVTVYGVGIRGLRAPLAPIDCGNSGTSMRLLSGLLAGQDFACELIGDSSLMKRPMRRVAEPLARMGAAIATNADGRPPVRIRPAKALRGIEYDMPVASAQVKSSLLLAGLYAQGRTCVREPAPTRDHSERMLRAFGYRVDVNGNQICLQGGGELRAAPIQVPADISSAAFFMIGASIATDSDILLTDVGINPTRTGVIDILRAMGADLTLSNQRELGGEPVADIRVCSAKLRGIAIPQELVPLAIDEFPAIFIAAANAQGETVLTGAEELRVKESDRIQVMADGLRVLGVDATPTPDGICIVGKGGGHAATAMAAATSSYTGGEIDSHGDHRIAMSFAMAALTASGAITIRDCANVATSFPGFVELAVRAGLSINAA